MLLLLLFDERQALDRPRASPSTGCRATSTGPIRRATSSKWPASIPRSGASSSTPIWSTRAASPSTRREGQRRLGREKSDAQTLSFCCLLEQVAVLERLEPRGAQDRALGGRRRPPAGADRRRRAAAQRADHRLPDGAAVLDRRRTAARRVQRPGRRPAARRPPRRQVPVRPGQPRRTPLLDRLARKGQSTKSTTSTTATTKSTSSSTASALSSWEPYWPLNTIQPWTRCCC